MAGKMNPMIRRVNVGTRELKEVKIYPLSIKDQTNLVEFFMGGIEEVFEKFREGSMTNQQVFGFIAETIVAKIPEFLEYVTDKDDKVDVDTMTNFQLSEIIKIVYEDNFENPGKNVENLVGKLKGMLFGVAKQ